MRAFVQQVIDAVSAWEGIIPTPHRFGGVEFNLGKIEIGHIHNHGMVDIPYTRRIRDALLAEHLALPHHLLVDSGWITTHVRSDGDVQAAVELYRLSYVHKRFRRRSDRQGADYQAALAALPFSSAIKLSLASPQSEHDDAE